jgi:hypothetical protein
MSATVTRSSSFDHPAPSTHDRNALALRVTGRIVSGIPAAFLLLDAAMKFSHVAPVTQTMRQLGWPVELAPVLGVILLASTILYIVPATAALGALLLTAYLGGAVATHLRVGNPLALYVLFPVYLGIMLWAGLSMRDRCVRALIPFRGTNA